MIELFNLITNQRAKSIKVKCTHVSYWRSESEKINNFITYIETNIDKFCMETYHVEYDEVLDDKYVKAFDIVTYMDIETFNYIKEHYSFLLEKYDKYIINLDDVKFYSLSTDYSRLRIH